jgi:rRNA (uridine-N3-)-methyltransferase BTM5-like
VVGDGDCSFSLSVATSLGVRNRLVCTTYDTRSELISKYSQSAAILKQLSNLNVDTHHSVDCQQLHSDERVNQVKYDRIVFNFPHVGGAKTEDVQMNKVGVGELVQG